MQYIYTTWLVRFFVTLNNRTLRQTITATTTMEKAGNDDIEEVPVVTLKPPVVSLTLTAATSKTKTMEFEWKLTKLPLNTNDVEVIKFETGVADETVT
jgi:hypothetical protein